MIFTALITIIVLSIYFVTAPAYKGFPFNREMFFPAPPGSGKLDYHFIKNLTENLSNVVFKYPKGRAFGTEGEHYAAENIIFPNMTLLKLHPINETIRSIPGRQLTRKIEVLEKEFKVNGKKVDCYIAPNWTKFGERDGLVKNISFSINKVKPLPSIDFDKILKNITVNFTNINLIYEELLEKLWQYFNNLSKCYNETEKQDFFYIDEDPFLIPTILF